MNRELATRASVELFRAALDTTLSREQKEQAIDVVLDRYLTHEPGCTAANGWCDAPERAYADDEQGCSCRTAGGGRNSGGAAVLGLLVIGAAASRRTGKRRGRRLRAPLVVGAVAAARPRAEHRECPDTRGRKLRRRPGGQRRRRGGLPGRIETHPDEEERKGRKGRVRRRRREPGARRAEGRRATRIGFHVRGAALRWSCRTTTPRRWSAAAFAFSLRVSGWSASTESGTPSIRPIASASPTALPTRTSR